VSDSVRQQRTKTALAPSRDSNLAAISERNRFRTLKRLRRHKGAMLGLVMLVILGLLGLFAPILATHDPLEVSANALHAPSRDHIMGTDNFGRDIYSRIVHGTRVSLQMGFVAMAIAATGGTMIGLVAGMYGGWIDNSLMRFIDALMAFPGILLALAIAAVLGTGLFNAMIAVGIAWIPTFARMVRSSVLQVREMVYVEAAYAVGCSTNRVMARHVFPNVLTPILILATLGIAAAILIGASLSFLGLGAQPPTPEWGSMLSQGRQFMRNAWWIMTFPGLAITITVMAANLLGDGLRDALDPRLKV
jgi:peptide/nickel transport system permease protein